MVEVGVWFWWVVLLAAVWASHWGADHMAEPLGKLRTQWGFSAAAGGVLIAVATASPEVSTNAMSVVRGASDIGLGNLLGSNIISVPAIVTVAYVATWHSRGQQRKHAQVQDDDGQHVLPVQAEASTVQAIPYLLILALVALLTLPAGWRGLQPVDGWIMLGAYVAYVLHALLRGRQASQPVSWNMRELGLALAGVAALVVGAYFTVRSTEHLVVALGISEMVGGLFITATMSIVPEVFATWSVAKSGQVTSATTSVIADNTTTMTLAFLPLALASTGIQDMPLFLVNFAAVAVLGMAYAFFLWSNRGDRGFDVREVVALNALYLVYMLVVLKVFFGVW